MEYRIKGATSPAITFRLVDSNGAAVTGLGAAPTVRVSKNGGAFAAGGGTVAELESGYYAYTPAAADVDTDGTLILTMSGTGAVTATAEFLIIESTGVLPTGYAPPAYTPVASLPADPNVDDITVWDGK
jgi:hypothetical protein